MFILNMKLIICGCAKNVQKFIGKLYKTVNTLKTIADEYKIIIFEDNSTDRTLHILKKWKRKDNNLIIISLPEINEKLANIKYRTHRIAFGRNMILKYIKHYYKDYNYMMMIDFDNVSTKLKNLNIIKEMIEFRENEKLKWDALSFNRTYYYDIWALRFENYNTNCMNNRQHRKIRIGEPREKISNILNNMKKNQLFNVYSAFNGFSIYAIDKIKNCYYDGQNKCHGDKPMEEDCEHVAFHNDMITKNNANICISPHIVFE